MTTGNFDRGDLVFEFGVSFDSVIDSFFIAVPWFDVARASASHALGDHPAERGPRPGDLEHSKGKSDLRIRAKGFSIS